MIDQWEMCTCYVSRMVGKTIFTKSGIESLELPRSEWDKVISELLENGWEPYAVGQGWHDRRDVEVLYFRRRVS